MSLLKVNEVQNYNGSSLTLTASTVSTSAQLNTGGNISVTGSINVSDDSTTRSNLGLGSIATQASDNVTITGGNISNATLDSSVSLPSFVGMIASFAMSSAPTGWLVCNGAEYAIADYGDLHTAIGTTWGALTNGSGGAGSTHFRVPDLRGEFLRGFDNGFGSDPDAASRTGGDAVGSSQSHMFGNHFHQSTYYPNGVSYVYQYAGLPGHSGGTATLSNATSAAGGNETRPRNKNVQYCIKY